MNQELEQQQETTTIVKTARNSKAVKKSLCISSVDPLVHQEFIKLTETLNLTQSQLFTKLFNNYKNLAFNFDAVETSLIEQAKSSAPSLEQKIKKMTIRYVQQILDAKAEPVAPINLKLKNSAKAADARADALITEILARNDHAVNWYDKILLTKSAIMDYATAKNKEDPEYYTIGKQVLNRCLERHQEQIDAHHIQHQLALNHNILAHHERLKTKREKTND